MSIESDNRKRIINTAKSYLGTVGGSSAHADILYFFNTVKPQGYAAKKNDPWCSEFVSACAIQTFGKKDAISYFPLSASCPRMITEARAKGIWVEKDSFIPETADFILYDWDDKEPKKDNRNTPDHVGIVEKVKDGDITVIEGNCGNKVKRRTLDVNGKYIRGFVTPRYDRIKVKGYKKTDDEIVKEVLSDDWGTGDERKKALTASGYDYDRIQKEVTRITKLTKKVLDNKCGVGDERVKKLGKDYDIVQWNVNRILKERND